MNGGDPAMFGHDALQKRVDSFGAAAATRRAEAIQAIRRRRWLEELRLRFEMPIEILDTDLKYVFDALPDGQASFGLRAALRGMGEPALRDAVAGVIRSGKARTLTAGDFRLRLSALVIRSGPSPTPIGVLVVSDSRSSRRRASPEEPSESVDRRLDAAGQWLVAAIEADLDSIVKEISEGRNAQRMAGGLDVVDALTQLQSDREIIALLMDAIALWYDADVYAYRQDLSGAFVFSACLPGGDSDRVPQQLPGHHLWARRDVFSPESRVELDELGWSPSMGHTLFVPIAVNQSTEYLLAIAEAPDDVAIRQTLSAFSRVVASLLSELQRRTMEALTKKLAAILLFSAAPFHATARLAFEALAAETGASSVQFTTFELDAGGPRPVLSLQWGGADTDMAPYVEADTSSLAADSVAVGISAGSGVTAVLGVKRTVGAFAPLVQRLVRSAASTIGIWLSGSVVRSLDLHVPDAGEYGAELLQRLRSQVDRFGHVRVGGAVAVLISQAQSPTGQAIDEAVDVVEHQVRPSDVIGVVGPTGAGVMIPDATRDVASAVVGRLLRAARDRGLVSVRVGVAMFNAASESPESVLERALMNARRGSTV